MLDEASGKDEAPFHIDLASPDTSGGAFGPLSVIEILGRASRSQRSAQIVDGGCASLVVGSIMSCIAFSPPARPRTHFSGNPFAEIACGPQQIFPCCACVREEIATEPRYQIWLLMNIPMFIATLDSGLSKLRVAEERGAPSFASLVTASWPSWLTAPAFLSELLECIASEGHVFAGVNEF